MHGQRVSRDNMKKIKGMRNIQTLYGVTHRAQTRTRAQAMTELSYLEHEKERVERELRIWAGNEKQAQCRLKSLQQRIAMLQKILEPGPTAARRMPSCKEEADEKAEPSWQEISLDY